MPSIVLPREFFFRSTLRVARSLIGKYLIRENGRGLVAGKIIEVEAYVGPEDRACHASKGRTARTEVLFGPPGHAYVYLCYGMYEMLNVVTEAEGFPAAILLRAVECDGTLIDGPGRLTRAFDIDRRLNRLDLTAREALWFEDRGEAVLRGSVKTYPRIGVDYAGEWAKKLWRFRLETGTANRRPPDRAGRRRSK